MPTRGKGGSRRGGGSRGGLRGASAKQRRMYEHIKKSAQRSGRYGGRAKQVAARTVNKQKSRS